MTPEQRQIEELTRRIELLEKAENIPFVQTMKRRLGGSTVALETGSLTGTTIAVRNSTDTGSELVADDYDGVINLIDGAGNTYRIGYYN